MILREVEIKDENDIREMYNEYLNSEPITGIDTFEGIRDFEKFDNMSFIEWMDDLEINKDENKLPKDYSTHTLYLAINDENKIVGAIGLRWKQVPVLMSFGGLIGYSIRPTERGNGYASEMLKLAIEKFKYTDINNILITCKDFNIASKKVIEKNGGKYENSYYNEDDGYTYLRYWINIM